MPSFFVADYAERPTGDDALTVVAAIAVRGKSWAVAHAPGHSPAKDAIDQRVVRVLAIEGATLRGMLSGLADNSNGITESWGEPRKVTARSPERAARRHLFRLRPDLR